MGPSRQPHDFGTALVAARAGRAAGFEWLFDLVADRLVAYCRAQGSWDPDGLANEVLVRAFTQIGQFTGDEPGFRAWVFSITRCRVIDERRAAARRPTCVPLDSNVLELFGGDVEHEVDVRSGSAWVDEILARLAPEQREVLLMRIVGELTIHEIADALGKSVGAVKALQRRALAAVRRELDACAEDSSLMAVSL